MSSPKSVSFFNSITTKITVVLLTSFTLIAFLIFYVVNKEGYGQIKAESERLIVQQGELMVKLISFDIASVMRSAVQLKDFGETLPITREYFEQGLDKVFTQNNHALIANGGIWPTAYELDASQERLPLLRQREAAGYSNVAPTDAILGYLNAPWYQAVKTLRPKTCVWSHATTLYTPNELAVNCSLAIERNHNFWGALTVNLSLDAVQNNMEALQQTIGEGYVVLVDNSNQVIAAAGTPDLTALNKATGKPLAMSDVITQNPAWQPVAEAINQQRQAVINEVTPDLSAALVDQLNTYDKMSGAPVGSMLINYAAHLQDINPHMATATPTYLGTYSLNHDSIYQADARAFVFTVPDTLWKLVIVKPTSTVNAIANNLRNNLAKYLLFALIAIAAALFMLLRALALRPLQETTKSIVRAEALIDENKYNQLSKVEFANTGHSEISVVNRSLQSLLRRIENNEGALANVNQQLEVQVEARTKELQQTLTELKSSQVQLIRSEKMATLGQMVAGVAHEVNTPLSYVQNNIEIIGQLTELYDELIEKVSGLKVAMSDPESSEEEIEHLMGAIMASVTEIEDDDLSEELKALIKDSLFGVEQITEMVLNLRNFARLDESKVKQIKIEECVDASLKITRNAIKHLTVDTQFAATPAIRCSPSQINQVFVNLINNAAQAIGTKANGRIDIRTKNDSSNIYIEVSDNGSGMTQETQQRVFEPFFTTKGAGEGTGLGMAICQQIIEQHGGNIALESQLDKGTTFHITLPIDGPIEG